VSTSNTRARANTLALGGAAMMALAWLWRGRVFFHDDAYISLRYVSRWLSGDGLSWTAGHPVEGFTHPLWILEIAALGLTGIELTWAPRFLAFAHLALLAVVFAKARLHPLGATLLFSTPAVWFWAWGGLETVAFGALLGLGLALSDPCSAEPSPARVAGVGATLSLATLLRPEAAALAVVTAGLLAFRTGPRILVPFLGGYLPGVGAWELFRLGTYGEWVSNSSLAKLGDAGLGWHMFGLLTMLVNNALLVGTTAICIATAMVCEPLPRGRLLTGAWVGTLVLVVVGVGGDHMPHGRFLVPILMVASVGVGIGAARAKALPRAAYVLVGSGLLLNLLAGVLTPVHTDWAAYFGAVTGRVLQEDLDEGALVSVATAGSTPYFAPDVEFIDALGLNDAHIAQRPWTGVRALWQRMPGHRKGDGAYILSREPDVIVMGWSTGTLACCAWKWFLSDVEIAESPAFRAAYTPYALLVDRPPGGYDGLVPWSDALCQEGEPPAWVPAKTDSEYMLVFYIRNDSPRADRLRAAGTALPVGTCEPNLLEP
jgi:hypothetical protein